MIIKRSKCVVCDGKLEHVYIFSDFPVYMGVNKSDEEVDTVDMVWVACEHCGCIQLQQLIEPTILYKKHHNLAIGETWRRHHEQLASLILDNITGTNILEVGGANLKLANILCRKNKDIEYQVLDLSAGKYDSLPCSDKITLVKKAFEDYLPTAKFNAILHSHTLEHAYHPLDFMKHARSMLTEEGVMVMSVPDIREQLLDGHTNALNFEHTFFTSEEYIKILILRSGFEIVEKIAFSKYNKFYVCRKSNREMTNINHSHPEEAKDIFLDFVRAMKEDVNKINSTLENSQFYSFGAHIFNQYMISIGLNTDNLIAILDNDDNKVNGFLSGTKILVKKPFCLEVIENPIVVLRAAQYTEEIRAQLKKINPGVVIL